MGEDNGPLPSGKDLERGDHREGKSGLAEEEHGLGRCELIGAEAVAGQVA